MKKLTALILLISLLTLAIPALVLADGTETLGSPSIPIESGSGIVAAGTGLETQPGIISLDVPGTVEQALLYWSGAMLGNIVGDNTITVNGTPVTGTLIGGPAFFYPDDYYFSSFRADITSMVTTGSNILSITDMNYTGEKNGAGVYVIYSTASAPADIEIRDGLDLAFINFPEPRRSTIPQTFNFTSENVDRTANLSMFFGSVMTDRPTSIEVTVGGVTTTYSDLMDSGDGADWDTISLNIDIPAGAPSLTVQALSRDDFGTGKLPASLSWIGAGLSVEPPPGIIVEKTADPTSIPEPGGAVTFTVVVTNNSGPTDPVTITSLVDDIHGNLNGQGTCSVPQTIQPGANYTCEFPATVSGDAGYSETDTVTASGTDDEGTPVSDFDDATVVITPLDPVIDVVKTADPTTIPEPGGTVTFTVVIYNNSGPTDPVTIDTLVDDIHGNLNGQGTCSVPQTIQPGGSYTCAFTATVSGSAGDSETDTVTASGYDDEETPVSDSDDATVTITGEGDGLPEIDVQKNADPVFVYEPGGMVTFTVEVTNNSGPTDPVTITSLVDDIHGNLNGQGTCSVPQTIQPGDTYTCEFTAMVQGSAGDSETDTVTASGTDDEGNPVSDSDDATVEVRGALYKVYFPNADNEKSIISRVPMTVGYEDLQFDRPDMDFDYNDWVTNIDTKLVINDQTQDLYRIDFTVTPRARGGVRSHAFHINIPANTFATDGTANLTIKDQFGNIVSSTSTPFDASQANDFNVIPCTCEAFPVQGQIINAIEGTPVMPTQRTAVLSIEFYTPGPFDQSYLDEDQISKPHGTGLFFDPYIDVIDFGFEVHQGDLRLLSVPEITWMWPEERVRIDEAYPLVTGSPPNFNFPNGWWKNHNTCVYGDGIPCPTALLEYMTAE